MAKEFIEVREKSIPYNALTLCRCLTQYAKDYIKEDVKYSDISNIRDGVIVDFINYLGHQGNLYFGFGLYTKDLYSIDDEEKHEIDGQSLLTVLFSHGSYYVSGTINNGISNSVLQNKHMNNCEEPFDDHIGASIIVSFINYIAKRNDFNRNFTIEELNQKFENYTYKRQMRELKRFLLMTNNFSGKLIEGQSEKDILGAISEFYRWGHTTLDGYHCDNEGKRLSSYIQTEINEKVYALGYAMAKLNSDSQPDNKFLQAKIKEMRKNHKR